MLKVVFLCQADYAGSAFQAVSAINEVGEISARQVVCHESLYGFDADVVCPSTSTNVAGQGPDRRVEEAPSYKEACRLLEDADLIHCWNDEYRDYQGVPRTNSKAFWGEFPYYPEKYKSVMFTGTWYRRNWREINRRLLERGTHLLVQTPAFIMPEMPSTYIGHAIDTTKLLPLSIEARNPGSIGCYHTLGTTANQDIIQLKEILKRIGGWYVVMEHRKSHAERLAEMAKCVFYMQDLDDRMINYGRGAIEAATLGVPVINSLCPLAKELMPDIPLLEATPETLEGVLRKAFDADYPKLVEAHRSWAVKYHDYLPIGRKYTEFFKGIA